MPGLGDGADIDSGIEVAVISGGGSMKVEELGGTMGSGSKGISSEPDEVSIVIWLVGLLVDLSVYRMGEHLTATEGFLCPGK